MLKIPLPYNQSLCHAENIWHARKTDMELAKPRVISVKSGDKTT